jgi:hypothetical protein
MALQWRCAAACYFSVLSGECAILSTLLYVLLEILRSLRPHTLVTQGRIHQRQCAIFRTLLHILLGILRWEVQSLSLSLSLSIYIYIFTYIYIYVPYYTHTVSLPLYICMLTYADVC